MEFKLMAGFIESDDPQSAISQFRKHIDRFTKEQGPWQLIFEHSDCIVQPV